MFRGGSHASYCLEVKGERLEARGSTILYGEKIENTPYEPMREGYTFGGWYKEAECINVWNFEQDTLPETLYNENNEEVYQETKLYAKWIKNNI